MSDANSRTTLIQEDAKPPSPAHVVVAQTADEESDSTSGDEIVTPLRTRKALWAWLILCFSTGPTNSMISSYVTASIQSAANAVGHIPGTDKPCARRGAIKCVVKLGGRDVDYLSYLLYLRAISRASEGVVSIMASGAADYSNYRKTMMMASIYLFGALALPFAGLTGNSYSHLNALSTLYVVISTVSGVYTVIEASYIPIFMRSSGWFNPPRRLEAAQEGGRPKINSTWIKGSRVSVLGLVSGNVGALVALLIGVIITYTRGSAVKEGYFNFLLAISIAGCLTILFAIAGHILLPDIPGRKRPVGKSIFLLPLRTWLSLLGSVRRYPNAFKLCVGWVLWNTAYGNFLSLLSALFLETTGIQRGSSVYTVYTFVMVLSACLGSLTWLFSFPHAKLHIKSWAYIFLSVNILCVLWGCIGISKSVPIGYKSQTEFWVVDVLFMSTSSALRSLNRVLYSSLIPKGSEAIYFGLEITLDLATGWINPLVQGVIQNSTHNLRFPMIPNLLLMVVALCLYLWTDVDKGIKDAETPLAASASTVEQGRTDGLNA
ncbi:autophagy-related protein 22 [Drechmeria coniospora]|uniref:Autophagy-related protein n=1 Tax=Drechmeria coniospora TaxID=98403 RepID=A0A151GJ18_DRECN|nr:autophagy-related protein 22 [Drechmeria coniospora]KYK57100.1 autophagy-related protein 22 [Drechmeria coniospora]ODA79005.1 hypothetical protein RJ55_04595 [Drechmeria coniospora]